MRLTLITLFFVFSSTVCAQYGKITIKELDVSGNTKPVVKDFEMPAGNYSGIAWLGGNRYAVVTDKKGDAKDGFYVFNIDVNLSTGKINSVDNEGYMSGNNSAASRDWEGVCYVPERNTIFISGEADQQIKEYSMEGELTGTSVEVPDMISKDKIWSNYGLEALTYNATTHTFWTCTESQLKEDGEPASPNNASIENTIRIVAFDDTTLKSTRHFIYRMDKPTATSTSYSNYAFGIPALCALDDGRLLVLEREFFVGSGLGTLNSFVNCKLYVITPDDNNYGNVPLDKVLLKSWRTGISNIANYEGMCLGPTLNDGSRLLIMVSDSQDRYKGILKDYIKTLSVTIEQNSDDDTSALFPTISSYAADTEKYLVNGMRVTGNRYGITISNGNKYVNR